MEINNFEGLNNFELEKVIIGSFFLEPSLLYSATKKLKPNDFFNEKNRIIYTNLINYTNEKDTENLDINLFIDYLKNNNVLEKIGGEEFLNNILLSTVHSSGVDVYIENILEYSKKRKLYELSRDITKQLFNNQESKLILENSQLKISELFDDLNNNGVIGISSLVIDELNRIEDLRNNPLIETKVKTKYIRYDEYTKGLHPSNLIILAARPSVGKTTLSLNIGLNVAEQQKKVLIFSLEMGEQELLKKLIAIKGEIDLEQIKDVSFIAKPEIVNKYSNALQELSKLDILIDAGATPTISNIKNTCRNVQRKGKEIGLIIIDYLQLIQGSGKSGSREQEISEISRGLKLLAKELNVPILALSQLSRKVDSREDKRPILSDLRESGSIEQDADQVLFIYNPEYHQTRKKNIAENSNQFFPIELLLAKHRNGQTGGMLLFFDKSKQKFRNPTNEEEYNYYNSLKDED
ncbi:replicative DNA helicase [Streptobacillus felis]|uniref:Replicative DNA helicase n=1 Tax=Streptobacillus felis TaxID=1384509 RepID=A0A7Z0T6Q0_9FUSO|nr:replicative DNA helicase [Streptobacillus felis]NYV27456.1 replicative DNA helicase [Streptobacillus felis]